MAKTKAFGVKLPEHLWKHVKVQSFNNSISMAKYIAKVIEKDFKKIEKRLNNK